MKQDEAQSVEKRCPRCDNPSRGGLCNACITDDYDDYDDESGMSDDDSFLEFECGMTADGYCMLAGTEDCDWSCPRTRVAIIHPKEPANDHRH